MELVWLVVKHSALDFIEEIFWLVIFNLIWCISALLILPFPFVTVGMTWAVFEIGQGKAIGWRTWIAGGRRYWKTAYMWGLINLLIGGIIFLNISFYRTTPTILASILYIAFVAVALWWIGMQLYTFPFIFLQEKPDLRMAYRNSIILMASRPLLTITVFAIVLALTGASIFLRFPFFVLYFVLLAILGNRAVLESVKSERQNLDEENVPNSAV